MQSNYETFGIRHYSNTNCSKIGKLTALSGYSSGLRAGRQDLAFKLLISLLTSKFLLKSEYLRDLCNKIREYLFWFSLSKIESFHLCVCVCPTFVLVFDCFLCLFSCHSNVQHSGPVSGQNGKGTSSSCEPRR